MSQKWHRLEFRKIRRSISCGFRRRVWSNQCRTLLHMGTKADMYLPTVGVRYLITKRSPNILFLRASRRNKRKKNKAMILARNLWKICCVAVLVTVALSCVMTQQTENLLSQAGFRSVPAKTPAQQARLKTLQADRITMVQQDGKEYFVFPDANQNMLYVGQKTELETY